MSRLTRFAICTVTISMFVGCAMCCGPYDDDYNVFGGKFHRVDAQQGRVGSILSDPAYHGGGPASDSNLNAREDSTSPGLLIPNRTDGRSSEEIQREMERLRNELQLDGDRDNELPRPTPQPDVDGDRETARGWQNRLRSRNRQWR